MPGEWFEDFFHGVALDLWRQAVSPEQTRTEAAALEERLALPLGAEILDVPCGDGRVALELARLGYRLTGVDISGENIERARAASSEIEWLCGDMRRLPGQARFDAAICVGNSFGYLEHDGTIAFLAALHNALKPGARAVLDTGMAAESLLPDYHERTWWEIGDILFLVENHYHVARGRLETHYTFIRDGVIDRRVGFQSVYTTAEIVRLLEHAGFEVQQLLDEAGAPFALKSRYLRVVALRAN